MVVFTEGGVLWCHLSSLMKGSRRNNLPTVETMDKSVNNVTKW